ncbi:MAG TPA: sigma-70 family RNA polymerase sigma factor [Acidobacteriaceae bacterium]
MYSKSDRQGTREEDVALLAGVEQGDAGALTLLFDKYSRLVYSVALRVLHDASAAEDVVQEIFMQVWRNPRAFSADRGSLGGWLAILARNRSIDVQRRRRPSDSVEDVVLTSSFDLAATAEKNILLEKAQGWIEALSDEQRETLRMAFFEGLTHAEIADKTGSPLGTIKTRIRRALQTLRKAAEA